MKLYILPICLLLGGCLNLPPAIQDAPIGNISYSQANKNINNYRDAQVRWGGVIIDVENEQTYSLVQIMYYPLNYYGRPQLNESNEGRFAIKSPEFLDPAIYTKNKEITIAGTVNGEIEQTIGKKTIRMPLVSASVIHLWPDAERNNYYDYGGYGFGYPYYPYYRGGFYGPYRW